MIVETASLPVHRRDVEHFGLVAVQSLAPADPERLLGDGVNLKWRAFPEGHNIRLVLAMKVVVLLVMNDADDECVLFVRHTCLVGSLTHGDPPRVGRLMYRLVLLRKLGEVRSDTFLILLGRVWPQVG